MATSSDQSTGGATGTTGSRSRPWPSPPRARFAWFRDHARVASESLSYLSARLATSLLVWLLIGIALALPAGLYLLQKNLSNLTGEWQGRPGLSVYFERGAQATDIDALMERARRHPKVQNVWHISPQEALAEFQEFSGLAESLDLLASNPLPSSLKVTLANSAEVIDLQDVARRLDGQTGVDEVVIEKTWLERLAALSSLVNRLGLILGCMFALGAVLVTASSVRLAIEARLDELRVQKLVGASDAFLRRPFLYFGLLYGLGGGLVALMLISAVLMLLETPLSTLMGSYGGSLTVVGFDVSFLAGMLALGGVLGLFGALLASQRRLSSIEVV